MGAWTKRPGEESSYALVPASAFNATRLGQIATYASGEAGRTITPQRVRRWLRRHTASAGTRNDAVWFQLEIPTARLRFLPPTVRARFGTAAQLERLVDRRLDEVDATLGTGEGDL